MIEQPGECRSAPVWMTGQPLASAAVVLLVVLGNRVLAQAPEKPEVEVEGTNVNGIVFQWKVTNNTKTAINYFKVPIYDINTFQHPDGWIIESQPRLKKKIGDFILRTDKYASMILPGRSLLFECMRPLADTGKDGRASVTIGFEDGNQIIVENVLAPVQPQTAERFAVPAFLAVLLMLAFVLKVRRDRKRATAGVTSASAEPAAPSAGAGA